MEAWALVHLCHSGTSTPEPPVLELSALNGTEDNPVTIYISAYSVDNASSQLIIRIISFPLGLRLSVGTFNGNIWILDATEFGDVELILPQHSSGRFEITAEVLYAESNSTWIATAQFTVLAVADVPTLNVIHNPCIDAGSFVFSINSTLIDSDGSETLLVTVSGLPSGTQLSAGKTNEQGIYSLEPAELKRSIIATIPFSSLDALTIVVTSTATETSNNSTASTSTAISVSHCQQGT